MKTLWTGTDSLMLIDLSKRKWSKKPYWIIFRIVARLIDLVCQEHYADSELVASELRVFGMRKKVSVFRDRVQHSDRYPKVEHEGFNILYYYPEGVMESKFLDWLYGRDIIERIKHHFPYCSFIEVNGCQDMSSLYPIVDFYLRPNRHDGSSRMIQECEIQNIPYYHSLTSPNFDVIIKQIKNFYEHKINTGK